MAALSGFGVGAGTIAGGLGIGAMNPLGTALLGIGEGSAGSTRAGVAPTTAPKGSGGATAGAKVNVTGTKELAPPDTTIPDVFRGNEGKVACYPACSTDPDAAFGPNRAAATSYKKGYEISANVILVAEGLLRIGTWIAGRGAASGVTRLYRAVGPAEFEQLMKTGKFAAGPNSLGGKFFAETAEHAAAWGEKMMGTGNFRIITADVPTRAASQFMRWSRLDAIGPAVHAELEQLEGAIVGVFK